MILYTYKNHIPFQIDDSDYEAVSYYSWCIVGVYPATNIRKHCNGIWVRYRTLYLFNFLLGKAPENMQWDHIDRDGLNNQRHNIRIATPSL